MYERIQIKNYRGIKDLTISDLGRVNLIVGANNVGKTSVLEALALLRVHSDDYELKQILESRGYVEGESESGAFTSMFAAGGYMEFTVEAMNRDGTADILLGIRHENWSKAYDQLTRRSVNTLRQRNITGYRLNFPQEVLHLIYASESTSEGENRGYTERTLNLEPSTRFPVEGERGVFGEVALVVASSRIRNRLLPEFLTDARRRGTIDPIILALQDFDHRIRDVSVAAAAGKTSIDVEVDADHRGSVTLPWTTIGDGVRRLWEMLVVLPRAQSGLGLIDEIDVGIYYENLPKLWNAVDSLSRESGVQIFATTHSLECVDAGIRAFAGPNSADFRLHRIEHIDDQVRVTTFNHEELQTSRELSFEFR